MASRRRRNEGGRLEIRPQPQDGYPKDRQQAHVTAILYGNLRAEIVSNAGGLNPAGCAAAAAGTGMGRPVSWKAASRSGGG